MNMPTRLPYGLSFVKIGATTAAYTLAKVGTPNVSMGTYWVVPATTLTITNFVGGEIGKIIYVVGKSDATTAVTLQNSAGGIKLNSVIATNSAGFLKYSSGTSSYLMGNNDVIQLINVGTGWAQVGAQMRID
jgi:hypothetical protein